MFAHFRPLFIIFIGLCLGIWLINEFRCFNTVYIFIILGILIVILLLSFLYIKFKNKFFNYLFKTKWIVLTLIVATTCGIGLFYIDLGIKNNYSFTVDKNEQYYIIGRLSTSPNFEENKLHYIIIDNVVATNSKGELCDIKENIFVSVSTENDTTNENLLQLKTGDIVTFSSNLVNNLPYQSTTVNTFYIKNNIRYAAFIDEEQLIVSEVSEYTLLDKAQLAIKNALYNNMDEKYAGLAFAILIGDTSGLDEEMEINFQISGITHLLAVSGLNVVFIITLLMPFFKLIKLKPSISVILLIIILGLYCVLCNLTPSVLRASLMAIFVLLGNLFGKQNDSLNSVSLAGIFILLFTPWSVFDLSFILSFVSVFAIIFLYPIFYDIFMKIKLGKFISSTLAISLAAQIGTMPFIINMFGYISSINLIANFLIVPFLGYVYMFMFVGVIITLILPFMGFLLWLCQWGFWLIDVLSSALASLPFASFGVSAVSIITVLLLLISMFVYSRNCILPKKKHLYLSLSLISLLCISIVIDFVCTEWWII